MIGQTAPVDLFEQKVFTENALRRCFVKKMFAAAGVAFIIFSMFCVFGELIIDNYVVSLISAILGIIGVLLFRHSEAIDGETALIASIMFIFGGIIIPLISATKEYLLLLVALFYVGALALIVLKATELTKKEITQQ